jgi:serine/threonine protein kinase
MSGIPQDPSSAALEDLLVEALARFESEGPAGVEELLGRHPAHATRVRSYLSRIHRLGLFSGDSAEPLAHPERLGEFRIVSELGQGGMGVVYRAVQESLGREVALKLVRPELLFFPGARERFQREIELVARMQHPGIVPVHAVGNEGGVPYFAMELVRGATLADVLEELSSHEPRTLGGIDLDRVLARRLGEQSRDEPAPLFRGTWNEVVLRILRELAEALEHAHRRGVLHRDVKPSNVMVTREGRVLLLDFGLAGAQGAERSTRTGSQLGSLAYMAPELLAGDSRELDVRSDVYALGATGWELFTLRLPYASSDPIRLRELAGTARRPRLDTIQPGLGWDVETVIATALEPDPERRYKSAAELARDLDHLLARRPIEAREIGPSLRLRRWSERHPARATALLALALVLLLAPLAWAWKEGDARRRVQRERDALVLTNAALETARVQSERHFHAALGAIGEVLRRTASDELENVPRLQRARLAAIERAQELLAELERDRPGDRAVQLESAALHSARAEVLYDQGRIDEALDGCRAAVALLGEVEPGEVPDVYFTARYLEAKLLQAALRWGEAAPIQRELAERLRARLAQAPDDVETKRKLALCLADLSDSLGHGVDPAQAHVELAGGHALARELAAAVPDDPDQVWILGRLAGDLAEAEVLVGELEAAAQHAEESLAAFRAAAALDPQVRFLQADVAGGLARLAKVEQLLGRDAEAHYRESLALLADLAREFPEALRYRLDQARVLDELAVSLRHTAAARAEPLHREALAHYSALLEEQPERCQVRAAAAVAHNNLANLSILYRREFDVALESCERGLELLEPCRARAQDDAQVADVLVRLTYFHALALCLVDEPELARKEIEDFGEAAGDVARHWRYACDLWCEWSLSVARRASPGAPDPGLEREGREHVRDTLRRALELGYRDVAELRATPALQPFLDDPELAGLLARLE